MKTVAPSVSIVTPTFKRPSEVRALLSDISRQRVLPFELILVDGSPSMDDTTQNLVTSLSGDLPYRVHYIRQEGGTAIQRNVGIDHSQGEFIAFIDDDVRLKPDFLERVLEVFATDQDRRIGAVVGYRTNRYFSPETAERWRWYKRLRLLKVYEPGRYDFECGYPVNNNMQAPFSGTRRVDFMTTACAVWRREVMDSGLRFDSFFKDYGVLEDAHFSLRAGKQWQLLQCGNAHCLEMHSPNGRVSPRKVGFKSVVNYYYVFNSIAGPLPASKKVRFWKFQAFELFRVAASAVRRRNLIDVRNLLGRIDGITHVLLHMRQGKQKDTGDSPVGTEILNDSSV